MRRSIALLTAGLFAVGTFACGDDSGATNEGGSNAGGSNAGGSNAGGSNAGGSNAGGSNAGGSNAGGSNAGGSNAGGSNAGGSNAGGSNAGGSNAGGSNAGGAGASGSGVLEGYWVWEDRVMGSEVQPEAPLDAGQMKIAFGTDNDKCHYIWNETTGSDFHTECTYTVDGEMLTYTAPADPDGTAAGYSCAHPDWTSWNDRPAVQWGRYKLVDDRLWLAVNAYWGGANGDNGSCKRFPFWESLSQAQTEEAWIVFKPVTREDWYGQYAISTNCQGTPELCAQWPGCGPGDKGYVD